MFLQTKLITDEVDIENYYHLLGNYKIQIRNKNKTDKTFESALKSYTSAFSQEEIEKLLDEMHDRGFVRYLDFP